MPPRIENWWETWSLSIFPKTTRRAARHLIASSARAKIFSPDRFDLALDLLLCSPSRLPSQATVSTVYRRVAATGTHSSRRAIASPLRRALLAPPASDLRRRRRTTQARGKQKSHQYPRNTAWQTSLQTMSDLAGSDKAGRLTVCSKCPGVPVRRPLVSAQLPAALSLEPSAAALVNLVAGVETSRCLCLLWITAAPCRGGGGVAPSINRQRHSCGFVPKTTQGLTRRRQCSSADSRPSCGLVPGTTRVFPA